MINPQTACLVPPDVHHLAPFSCLQVSGPLPVALCPQLLHTPQPHLNCPISMASLPGTSQSTLGPRVIHSQHFVLFFVCFFLNIFIYLIFFFVCLFVLNTFICMFVWLHQVFM